MTVRLQLVLFASVIFLSGCKKEEPNPELLDPIYTDLVNQENSDTAALAAEQKKLVAAKQSEVDAEPMTIDLKNARRDIIKSERIIQRLNQMITYDHIRTERRKVEDKVAYHIAFAANKEWPEKQEYQQYLVNRRLASAPRDWDAHLPKLFGNKKPIKKAEKKEE